MGGTQKTDMKVDSTLYGSKTFSKDEFAEAMGCKKELIDSIDEFTGSFSSLDGGNPVARDFLGNLEKRYCGRYYRMTDFVSTEADEEKTDAEAGTKKWGTIWVGLCFDLFSGAKLMVAFWDGIELKTGYHEKLEKLKALNYCSRYEKAPKDGYWYFVPVIDNVGSIAPTKDDVEGLIKEVLEQKVE